MAVCTVVTLFACDGSYRQKQLLTVSDYEPVAVGENINLKYTDSGKVVTHLNAKKIFDFSNFDFPFTEFPEGLTLYFWDEEGRKSTIMSDYGIQYDKSGLVDLRGNVQLFTHDSTVLKATQLYWDQNNQWVFTDQPYEIHFKNGSSNEGISFDSNEDFTNFISLRNIGVQVIEKTEENE